MNRVKINEKNILNPPEKVLKMYEAVTNFLSEGRDLNAVKVSDITTSAGIGKGTAYEYFSSKEEIIVSAMIWGCGEQIRRLTEEISEGKNFREKCFCLFGWLKEHREYNGMLLRIVRENVEDFECQKTHESNDFERLTSNYLHGMIDQLMEQGYQEGIFTEENADKRSLAFFGAVLQYVFVVMGLGECRFKEMDDEELKDFIYSGMVKALN